MSTTDLFSSLIIHGKKLAELLPDTKNKLKTIDNIVEKVVPVINDLVQTLEKHREEFSAEEWFPNVVRKIERSLDMFVKCDLQNESTYRHLATEVGKFNDRPLSDNTNKTNTIYDNNSTNSDNNDDGGNLGESEIIDKLSALGELKYEKILLLAILSSDTREVEMKRKDLFVHSYVSAVRGNILISRVLPSLRQSESIREEINNMNMTILFIYFLIESLENNFDKCLRDLVKHKLIEVVGVTSSSDRVRNRKVGLKYKIPIAVRNVFYGPASKQYPMFEIRGTNLFNMEAVRLNSKTLYFVKNLEFDLLDLGNWNDDLTKYIVVEDMDVLKNILSSGTLDFLTLKGISGIVELPSEVYANKTLNVLDLRGCPNLESLAQGIHALRELRYLDLSECYLLDHIPQEISRLTELRVLKGFIVSKSRQYPSPSSTSLNDLSSLKRLWKLTIRTRDMKFPSSSDLSILCNLEHLTHLKITWVGTTSDSASMDDDTSEFPAQLRKFEMEAAIESTPTQLLKLIARQKDTMRLEKLYIRGGSLCKLVPDINCKILRLEYLPGLRLNCHEMIRSFPGLHRLEMSLDVIYSLLRQSFEIATSSLDRDINWKPSLTSF